MSDNDRATGYVLSLLIVASVVAAVFFSCVPSEKPKERSQPVAENVNGWGAGLKVEDVGDYRCVTFYTGRGAALWCERK